MQNATAAGHAVRERMLGDEAQEIGGSGRGSLECHAHDLEICFCCLYTAIIPKQISIWSNLTLQKIGRRQVIIDLV